MRTPRRRGACDNEDMEGLPLVFSSGWTSGINAYATVLVMGLLGRTWIGRTLIDLLGHMRAPDGVGVTLAGLAFPSRVGLGCHLDPALRATGALARFGCGFVEVGPIRIDPRPGNVWFGDG